MRTRYKSIEDKIIFGISCKVCHWNKAKYEDSEQLGKYVSVRFRCKHCNHITIQICSLKEWKVYNENAKR